MELRSRLSAQTPTVRPTFAEFFCGGGMARAGLGPGWDCALAHDNNIKKARGYAANWGAQGLIVGDIASLTTVDLPGAVDLAHASPPCVGASLAGKRKGLGPEAWAFMTAMQGLRSEGRATPLIAIENVPDLLTSLDGRDFDRICGTLSDIGYHYGVVMIDAALFVPQSRERVFIVAVDAAQDVPADIVANGPSLPFHQDAVVKALHRQKARPIWWRLPVPPPHNLTLADLLEDEHKAKWDTPAKTAEIVGMMDKPHLDRLNEDKRTGRLVVRSINWRGDRKNAGKKVSRWESRPDLIANCLRTASGGSSTQSLLFVEGPSVRTRKISPLEYARTMGLPDSYRLPAGRTASYNLTGDGVVVPVVRYLAEHIFEPILQASGGGLGLVAE
jgi:DNA (cytosine-5)-methyltransferase 1